MATSTIENRKVVSRAEWLAARKELLIKEKQFTHLRDELSRQRLALPWVKVEKSYGFDGPNGKQTLADLFDGRSQLIIYHFMFGPGWGEGCVGCSFLSDHLSGPLMHLPHHDVSLVVVSRAPLAEIEAFRKRMGWGFKWLSSNGGDFNYDYHVSFDKDEISKGKVYYNFEMQEVFSEELPGVSVFSKTLTTISFTPIPATRGVGKVFWERTVSSISPPTDATKPVLVMICPTGSAIMIAITPAA